MKEQDKKFIANWEKIKSEGFKKYLLTHGLAFGILITIINLMLIHYNSEKETNVDTFLATALIMLVVGGFAYAGVSWLVNEYIYNKKTKK